MDLTGRRPSATRWLRGRGPADTNAVPGHLRFWVLAGILLVQFLANSSATILSTSAPAIADDLHGLNLYAWLFTGYLFAYTVTVPVVGKLSDLYGRRPFMLGGLALFVAGSALSGLAPTMVTLVAARIVTGFGGGAIMSLTAAMVGDLFSPRDRARWMASLIGVYGVASIVGPSLGGVLTDHLGWRWIFFANLPFGLAAFGVLSATLSSLRPATRPAVDWLGIALLMGALIPLLLAFTWGGTSYPWLSPPVLGGFAIGGALVIGFVVQERRAPEPLLGPDLFRSRLFTITVAVQAVIGMALLAALTFIPLYFEGARGETAQEAGLVLAPLMVGFVGGSVVSGQAVSISGRWKGLVVGGMALVTLGLALLSTLTPATPAVLAVLVSCIPGLGLGIAMPVTGTAVLSAFPYRLLGTVNSARQFFNNLGSLVGTAVLTTVILAHFQATIRDRIPAAAGSTGGAGSGGEGLLSGEAQAALADRLSGGGGQARAVLDTIHASLAAGIGRAFLIAAILAAAATLAALALPQVTLRTTIDDDEPPVNGL